MIVSALLKPEPSGVPAGKRWRSVGVFTILAMVVMAIVRLWGAAGLVTHAGDIATTVAYPSLTAFLADLLAAAVVAFIFSGVHSPRQGVWDLLHSLDPRSRPIRWYWWVIAVGLYPAIITLGTTISAGLGMPAPAPKATSPGYWLVLDALIMLPYFLFAGGGLEEPGWRGFVLPMLQRRYGPMRSSLILAVIWAFWHWPMLQVGLWGMVVYLLLYVTPAAILFTAVFNRTGGSLPIVILLHPSTSLNNTCRHPCSYRAC
jgi:membrane protease YdiL (CAAX protease family)